MGFGPHCQHRFLHHLQCQLLLAELAHAKGAQARSEMAEQAGIGHPVTLFGNRLQHLTPIDIHFGRNVRHQWFTGSG